VTGPGRDLRAGIHYRFGIKGIERVLFRPKSRSCGGWWRSRAACAWGPPEALLLNLLLAETAVLGALREQGGALFGLRLRLDASARLFPDRRRGGTGRVQAPQVRDLHARRVRADFARGDGSRARTPKAGRSRSTSKGPRSAPTSRAGSRGVDSLFASRVLVKSRRSRCTGDCPAARRIAPHAGADSASRDVQGQAA